MGRSNEPLWWGPFSAGMMIGALFLPRMIFLIRFLLPANRPYSAESIRGLVNHPLTRIFLVVVISLSFFHFGHRFRYIIFDLGLHGAKGLVAFLCYGSAVAGTVIAIGLACGWIQC